MACAVAATSDLNNEKFSSDTTPTLKTTLQIMDENLKMTICEVFGSHGLHAFGIVVFMNAINGRAPAFCEVIGFSHEVDNIGGCPNGKRSFLL